jgi:NAD(P)-dependent dehydrogenase (short-subunit alcohol dehydrogenase family)
MNPRTSLVTGGTGGLGQAVVARFLRRGDRVLVPWIEREEADALRERLEGTETGSSARLVLMEGDVNDAGWLRELSARLEGEYGLDVLCNLVGGFAAGALRETDLEVWDRMMALNARSVFGVTRAVAGALERSGRGRVVNMAALPAVTGRGDGMAAYTASKAAVVALTRALSRELRPTGVTVNAIAPSVIDTPANREAMPDADPERWVTPAEIAALMDFLTGDEGGAVTGNVMVMAR